MEMKEIIDACVKRRQELCYTQRDLAKICGLPQSAIARFEKNVNAPTLHTLLKILDSLKLKIEIAEI